MPKIGPGIATGTERAEFLSSHLNQISFCCCCDKENDDFTSSQIYILFFWSFQKDNACFSENLLNCI